MKTALGAMPPRRGASELKFRVMFFVKLLVSSYILMKLILYLTRVMANYFVNGVWKFF
jgi:hypothetical protein